jgi:hypothetical protein
MKLLRHPEAKPKDLKTATLIVQFYLRSSR